MKISDLDGVVLDWLVAKCATEQAGNTFNPLCDLVDYSPSTDWSIGGPFISREWISVYQVGNDVWKADIAGLHNSGPSATPLIAAMRCYVISKLGNELTPELIKELT